MPDTASFVSALILAGGKATRMGGVAKHRLVVDGQTIFERQVAVLAPRVKEVLVSSPTDIAGYRTVRDAVPDVGPLAGIAAGLAACTTPWLLVIAGDMPHITGELVDRLIAEADNPLDYPTDPLMASTVERITGVGIRSNGYSEPLVCALECLRALPIVQDRIAARWYKAGDLLTDDRMIVRWITDADPAALRNVNSPEDLG